jgi:hypothetical protein
VSKCINNYKQAVLPHGHDLYAVEMVDGGWSIADGEGVLLTPEDEIELAGWHLPVAFDNKEKAIECIESAPHVMFDIVKDAEWTQHAIKCGAVFKPEYEM